jgi:hypothetical protein
VSPALLTVLGFVSAPRAGARPIAVPAAVREFEVASIRLSQPGAVGSLVQLRSPQGGTTAARNVPLRDLILVAYHLQAFRLSGGPAWLSTERYDLEAKYQPTASMDDIRAMLQKFLADRSKLGSYGFNLEGTREEGGMEANSDREPSIDSTRPSIFTAIQEQLGLRLESARGTLQNIVIQRIEKPSEN